MPKRKRKLSSTQEAALISLLHGKARKWEHSRGLSMDVRYAHLSLTRRSEIRRKGGVAYIEGATVRALIKRHLVLYEAGRDRAVLTDEGRLAAELIDSLRSEDGLVRVGAIVSEVLHEA